MCFWNLCIPFLKNIWIALLLLHCGFNLISFPLFAQQDTDWKFYTTESGLIGNNIYSVMQDSRGYLWVSTTNGVSRFNGYEFENFTIRDGLVDNCIFFTKEDDASRIWFVGISPELCYYSYEDRKIHAFEFNNKIAELQIKRHFRLSMVVHNKEVWVGNWLDGYFHVDKNGNAEHGVGNAGMNVITVGGEKLIFESYEEGSLMKNGLVGDYGTEFQKIHIDSTYINFGFPMRPGWQEIILMDGQLYVRFLNAIFQIVEDTIVKVRVDDERVGQMFVDIDSNLLVSYLSGKFGFRTFENISNMNENPLLQLDGIKINQFTRDNESSLWIASDQGLYFSSIKPLLQFSATTNELTSVMEVNDILVGSSDNVFVRYSNGVVYQWQGNSSNPMVFSGANRMRLHSAPLCLDLRRNTLLDQRTLDSQLRTAIGLKVSDFKVFPSIHNLFPVDSQRMWMATEQAIYLVDQNRILTTINPQTPISNSQKTIDQFLVNALFYNDSVLYIGTALGFYLYDHDKLRFLNELHPSFEFPISDIKRGNGAELYLASEGSGLIIWSHDSIVVLTEKNGLSNNIATELVVDRKGNTWVGTPNGLNLVKKTNEGYEVSQILGTRQGLPSNHVTDLAIRGNELWVGTTKGLVVLDINKIKPNTTPPFMHITGFKVDEVDTTLLDNYEFEHDQNYFVIEYTGIAFKNAGNLDYEYQLEGVDKNWLKTKGRTVRYNKLEPGKYTFNVKAANEDGYWSETASLSFTVLPPYWQTWWFRASLFLTLTLTLTLAFRYRLQQVKAAAATKHRLVELELKSLRAQMNPHFTFNSLISIQRFIMDNDALSANDYLSDFAALIRRVLENSRDNVITLENELQTLKMYLDLEKLRFKNRLVYHINIAHDLPIGMIMVPSNLIQPYVENAIVHGILHRLEDEGIGVLGDRNGEWRVESEEWGEGSEEWRVKSGEFVGRIDISVERKENLLVYVITDNGVGRKKSEEINARNEARKRSLGMEITQERMDILNKTMDLEIRVEVTDLQDENGNATGTRVEVQLPINN